jgi:hypothetical protein
MFAVAQAPAVLLIVVSDGIFAVAHIYIAFSVCTTTCKQYGIQE